MVEVEVGQEDVDPPGCPGEAAELPDPCAGVEDQLGAVPAAHLDARGVPPVAGGRRPRRGTDPRTPKSRTFTETRARGEAHRPEDHDRAVVARRPRQRRAPASISTISSLPLMLNRP